MKVPFHIHLINPVQNEFINFWNDYVSDHPDHDFIDIRISQGEESFTVCFDSFSPQQVWRFAGAWALHIDRVVQSRIDLHQNTEEEFYTIE